MNGTDSGRNGRRGFVASIVGVLLAPFALRAAPRLRVVKTKFVTCASCGDTHVARGESNRPWCCDGSGRRSFLACKNAGGHFFHHTDLRGYECARCAMPGIGLLEPDYSKPGYASKITVVALQPGDLPWNAIA